MIDQGFNSFTEYTNNRRCINILEQNECCVYFTIKLDCICVQISRMKHWYKKLGKANSINFWKGFITFDVIKSTISNK